MKQQPKGEESGGMRASLHATTVAWRSRRGMPMSWRVFSLLALRYVRKFSLSRTIESNHAIVHHCSICICFHCLCNVRLFKSSPIFQTLPTHCYPGTKSSRTAKQCTGQMAQPCIGCPRRPHTIVSCVAAPWIERPSGSYSC